jgi:hypothetical protein
VFDGYSSIYLKKQDTTSTRRTSKRSKQGVPFVVSRRTKNLSHRSHKLSGTSCDNCRVEGHDKRDTSNKAEHTDRAL